MLQFFIRALFGEMFRPNLYSFVWRRHVGVNRGGGGGTNVIIILTPTYTVVGGLKVTEASVIEFSFESEELSL